MCSTPATCWLGYVCERNECKSLLCNSYLTKSHFFFFPFYFITQVLTHCKSTNLFFCSMKETALQSVTRTQPIVTSWWKCSVLKPLPWIQYRSPVAEGLMRIEEPGTNITTPAVQAPCSSLSACSEFNPTCLHSWQMLMLIWLTQAEWVTAGAC